MKYAVFFSAGACIGACIATMLSSCATTKAAPLHITTIVGANNERCYSEADDSAWRQRLADYADCCNGVK